MNSAELKFDKVTCECSNGTTMESTDVNINEEAELATVTFANSLKVGPGKLHINFTGILNDKLKGFYRSKYVHPSGEERYAATTQFEVKINFLLINFLNF